MSDRETKKLINRISFLEKQNAKLKKEVAKQKRYVNKATDIILDNYDAYSHKDDDGVDTRKKKRYCDECGKGELRQISILNLIFDICGLCGFKKKIK